MTGLFSKAPSETTKEKILRTAAEMFSERGYDRVTMREIAKGIGINSGSIYNHFASKEEILTSLYSYYVLQMEAECPVLAELLSLAETDPPHEVLMKSGFYFKEDVREFLSQIIIIATRMICSDPKSKRFIEESIFEPIHSILKPLLAHMVAIGKIKPFDVDTFIKVFSYYAFSAAALNNTPFRQSVADYQDGMSFLLSIVE